MTACIAADPSQTEAMNGSGPHANTTALFIACWKGYAEVVSVLLGSPGADVNLGGSCYVVCAKISALLVNHC